MRQKQKDGELDGLCDPISLDEFIKWRAFGGEQRGMSYQEVSEMPAVRQADFLFILSYIGEERDSVPKKPKTSGKRGRR